jgi:hypothetical protein
MVCLVPSGHLGGRKTVSGVATIRTTEVGYQQNHRRAEMALSAGKHLPEHVIALEARRGESGAASSRPAHPFAHRFLRLPIALGGPSGPSGHLPRGAPIPPASRSLQLRSRASLVFLSRRNPDQARSVWVLNVSWVALLRREHCCRECSCLLQGGSCVLKG